MTQDGDEGRTAQIEGANRAVTDRLNLAVKAGGGHALVSERSRIKSRTLSHLLAGQEPKYGQLLAIAEGTGVRLEWLATGRGPMHPSEAGVFEAGTELASLDLMVPTPGTVRISRYDARASAGDGMLAEGAIIGSIEFMDDWLRRNIRRDPRHLALLECWGDSMEPTIKDGDILMIDTGAREVLSGRIYVLQVDGELRVKRVEKRVAGPILVVSDNDRYPVEELGPDQVDRLVIVGEVVWFGRLARRA